MKTQHLFSCRTLSAAVLSCLFALSVPGFSAMAAEENNTSIPDKAEQAIQSVNINTADALTIAGVLRGVGLKKAAAIVRWREENGQFTNVEQLLEVRGIGEKTLSANRSRIRL